MGIIHGHMSVDAVKHAAKKYDATINEFLVAVFIWAIYQEYLKRNAFKTAGHHQCAG